MSRGIDRIRAERRRQIEAEGYDAAHDDHHGAQELAIRAAELLVDDTQASLRLDVGWEADAWGLVDKYRTNRIQQLAIAGALVAAEIDRLERSAHGERVVRLLEAQQAAARAMESLVSRLTPVASETVTDLDVSRAEELERRAGEALTIANELAVMVRIARERAP